MKPWPGIACPAGLSNTCISGYSQKIANNQLYDASVHKNASESGFSFNGSSATPIPISEASRLSVVKRH